jgi:hypothetical protein
MESSVVRSPLKIKLRLEELIATIVRIEEQATEETGMKADGKYKP